jgi:hypothetical protein
VEFFFKIIGVVLHTRFVGGFQREYCGERAEIDSVYVILSYATCVLLVAIAATALFGLCVAAVIVQEGLRNVGTSLSRLIPLEKPETEGVR